MGLCLIGLCCDASSRPTATGAWPCLRQRRESSPPRLRELSSDRRRGGSSWRRGAFPARCRPRPRWERVPVGKATRFQRGACALAGMPDSNRSAGQADTAPRGSRRGLRFRCPPHGCNSGRQRRSSCPRRGDVVAEVGPGRGERGRPLRGRGGIEPPTGPRGYPSSSPRWSNQRREVTSCSTSRPPGSLRSRYQMRPA